MRPLLLALGAASSLFLLSRAQDDKRPALRLVDPAGKPHAVTDLGSAKAVVLFFTSIDCPSANRYGPRLKELHRTYAERGVRFFAVFLAYTKDKEE